MENFLDLLFTFIVWMNKHLFEPLNSSSVRIDSFIGIASIIIAVVIFVAETMNDKKSDTQKKFILYKTRIKETLVISVLILSFCIVKEILPYNDNCSNLIIIIFFILELALNVLIIISIYLTIRMFIVSIKLNTESKYFYEEYYKYIRKRINNIHKKNYKNINKKSKDESMRKFVKENEKYFYVTKEQIDGYIPVKANRSGIFNTYSLRALQTIIDKVEEKKINNPELIVCDLPLFLLPLKKNEKINRGVTIAYYKIGMNGYEDLLRNSVLLNDRIPYPDDEINLIVCDLFSAASSKKNMFDEDSRLYKYFNYLYENEMFELLSISYEYIRKVYVDFYKNLQLNRELAGFLGLLANLAYYYEDYERYKFICDYIYYCYREQLNKSSDIRKVSYEFVNTIIRYDYYSIKKNDDSIYFDVLLSNFMNFLFDLIARKEFKAINDIFQNVVFDYNHFINDEPDEYDIRKIQFSFGFVYGLIVLSNKDSFVSKNKEDLKTLVNNIKTYFVDFYNQNDAILYFNRYYKMNSNIQDVYSRFDFRFENKEYRNSFSGFVIDDIIILKEFMYVFNINYSNLGDINRELVDKEKKYFYQRLLKLVDNKDTSKVDTLLNIEFNPEQLIKLLEKLIELCDIEEKKYIKNYKINPQKKEEFKQVIFNEFEKGNQLVLYLKKEKKYSLSSRKGKRLLGFNQILGREMFFDNVGGLDNISKQYAYALLDGISKDYLKKLDSISEIVNYSLDDYINSLDDHEEYVIITSPSNWRKINLSNFDDEVVFFGTKKVKLIKSSKAKDIYLISKKNMPKIEMLIPEVNGIDISISHKGVYYDLIDCSYNKTMREDVQKNTKWLQEKGNEEDQMEFLKGKLVFKLFISPSIKKIPSSKCYKFVINENDR